MKTQKKLPVKLSLKGLRGVMLRGNTQKLREWQTLLFIMARSRNGRFDLGKEYISGRQRGRLCFDKSLKNHLCKFLGCGRRQVLRHLRGLEARRVIYRARCEVAGRGVIDTYRLNPGLSLIPGPGRDVMYFNLRGCGRKGFDLFGSLEAAVVNHEGLSVRGGDILRFGMCNSTRLRRRNRGLGVFSARHIRLECKNDPSLKITLPFDKQMERDPAKAGEKIKKNGLIRAKTPLTTKSQTLYNQIQNEIPPKNHQKPPNQHQPPPQNPPQPPNQPPPPAPLPPKTTHLSNLKLAQCLKQLQNPPQPQHQKIPHPTTPTRTSRRSRTKLPEIVKNHLFTFPTSTGHHADPKTFKKRLSYTQNLIKKCEHHRLLHTHIALIKPGHGFKILPAQLTKSVTEDYRNRFGLLKFKKYLFHNGNLFLQIKPKIYAYAKPSIKNREKLKELAKSKADYKVQWGHGVKTPEQTQIYLKYLRKTLTYNQLPNTNTTHHQLPNQQNLRKITIKLKSIHYQKHQQRKYHE